MEWNRSSAIGIARVSCTYCHGNGTRVIRQGTEVPCNCAYRAAFRACLNRFRECSANGAHTSTVTWEPCAGRDGRRSYSRKREEFLADFCLVSRRVLDDFDHKVFRYHFLLGADWRLCCRELRLDRGTVFHSIYRIEQQLGRAFGELKPYPLYPLSDYFSGGSVGTPLMTERRGHGFPIRASFPAVERDEAQVSRFDQPEQPEQAMAAGAAPIL